jgi:hypothetical protein
VRQEASEGKIQFGSVEYFLNELDEWEKLPRPLNLWEPKNA